LALLEGIAPVRLPLVGAFIEADVDDAGCTNGKLGGGIREADLQATVLPDLARVFDDRVGLDGPACRADIDQCSDPVKQLLQSFDTDGDGHITTFEFLENTLVQSLLAPDVDLFDDPDGDGVGRYAPRTDGIVDSLSFGMGFTCAKAVFPAPGE